MSMSLELPETPEIELPDVNLALGSSVDLSEPNCILISSLDLELCGVSLRPFGIRVRYGDIRGVIPFESLSDALRPYLYLRGTSQGNFLSARSPDDYLNRIQNLVRVQKHLYNVSLRSAGDHIEFTTALEIIPVGPGERVQIQLNRPDNAGAFEALAMILYALGKILYTVTLTSLR